MSLPGRTKEQAAGRLLDRGRADRAEAAQPVRLAFQHQHPRGDPGAGPGAELDPGGAGVEVGAGRVGEAGALEPDPALGVLGAPVVADHPRPAVELDRSRRRFPAGPRSGRRGKGATNLVRGSGASYSQSAGRYLQGRRRRGRSATRRRRGPRCRPSPRRGRGRSRRRRPGSRSPAGPPARAAGTVTLVARGPSARAVEEDEPDRGVRLGAGPLVDRVADPDPAAAARLAGLDVEALVVTGLGGTRGNRAPSSIPEL